MMMGKTTAQILPFKDQKGNEIWKCCF